MTFEDACKLLEKTAPGDENWKRHSYQVAAVAYCLSLALMEKGEDLDPDYIRVCALLHDIGRSRTHGPLHGWVGYVLLRKIGAAKYSRGCIVHWLKGRTQAEVLADGILSARFVRRLYEHFKLPHLSLSDKVMALADSLVMHDKVVELEKRYADLRARYGSSHWLDRHYEFSKTYQDEIEEKIGKSLNNLLAHLMN